MAGAAAVRAVDAGQRVAQRPGAGSTEAYCLFVDQHAAAGLPQNCCTLSVSPLLRELLLQASTFEPLYDEQGAEGRLTAAAGPAGGRAVENLHLPVSDDAHSAAEGMLSSPADKSTLGQWAQRIGMSERSLSRTLQQQMGMSFGHWRRQLHVMLALQRLTQGERTDGGAGSGLQAPAASSPCSERR